jgi:HSP90 family molecular chaperone
LPPQVLEINPKHPIIKSLSQASLAEGDKLVIAELVAAQVLDNALIAAGLIDDARSMLPRLNNILSASLK